MSWHTYNSPRKKVNAVSKTSFAFGSKILKRSRPRKTQVDYWLFISADSIVYIRTQKRNENSQHILTCQLRSGIPIWSHDRTCDWLLNFTPAVNQSLFEKVKWTQYQSQCPILVNFIRQSHLFKLRHFAAQFTRSMHSKQANANKYLPHSLITDMSKKSFQITLFSCLILRKFAQ